MVKMWIDRVRLWITPRAQLFLVKLELPVITHFFSYYTREQNWSQLIFLSQFIVFAAAPNIIVH